MRTTHPTSRALVTLVAAAALVAAGSSAAQSRPTQAAPNAPPAAARAGTVFAPATGVTSPTVDATEALRQYAAARCNHEARCGRIGAGRAHVSREACFTDVINARAAEWRGVACLLHTDATALARCMGEVAAAGDCFESSDEALAREAVCRAAAVCSPSE